MRDVYLALNICTYKRKENLLENLSLLKSSRFFDEDESDYYDRMDIFITDNASELEFETNERIHLKHNKNTGGSGGFQKGIEEIRKSGKNFTHVIFMDDDVKFELDAFYILFDFLKNVSDENADRPVAGRMFDIDNPNIQWTAAEKWNGGDIQHVEFLRDINDENNPYTPGKVIYDADADYGGFWFCCYPYNFVKDNDILPFFLHCDDVEYGLRCGKKPIIIEGVHVWHETWEKKMSPAILYYDYRNSLFVNERYGKLQSMDEVMSRWKERVKEYHQKKDWLSEYIIIVAMKDFLRGMKWLEKNNEIKLKKIKTNKINNICTLWFVVIKAKLKRFNIA